MSKNNINNNSLKEKEKVKDSNINYKQIFANPMKTYSDKETKAIDTYFNKLRKQKRNK